jgi:hypothetical protein
VKAEIENDGYRIVSIVFQCEYRGSEALRLFNVEYLDWGWLD